MSYRLERVQASDRVAYILYSERMAYLATMSWHKGVLVYEQHQPEMANVSAREFEPNAIELDKGATQ